MSKRISNWAQGAEPANWCMRRGEGYCVRRRALERCFLAAMCSTLFIGYCSAQSLEFELTGLSTFENFNPDGSKYKTFSGRFSVQKSHESWRIVFSPDDTATSEEVMFDGVDVYVVTRNIAVNKEPFGKGTISSNKITYATSPLATVYSGQYPHGATSRPRLLWLALLSSSIIHTANASAVPAPWDASYAPESRSFNLTVDWPMPNGPFPSAVRFIASNELWTNVLRELMPSQVVSDVSPFEDGFIAGTYQVRRWTNLSSGNDVVAFPAEFELERRFPPRFKTTSKVAERYRCQVTKVMWTKSVITRPELSDHVNVLDYRLMNKDLPWFYVSYPIADRIWKATNDPVVNERIESAKSNYFTARSLRPHGYKSANSRPRAAARYCIAAMMLGSALLLTLCVRRMRLSSCAQ